MYKVVAIRSETSVILQRLLTYKLANLIKKTKVPAQRERILNNRKGKMRVNEIYFIVAPDPCEIGWRILRRRTVYIKYENERNEYLVGKIENEHDEKI